MDQDLEKRMRQIAEEVYSKNTDSSETTAITTARHLHNGVDSLQLSAKDIIGFQVLPDGAAGVLGPMNNYNGGTFVQSSSGNTVTFTVPVISFGSGGDFSGGDAPDGTIIFASGGADITTNLWVRYDGSWWGFQAATHF